LSQITAGKRGMDSWTWRGRQFPVSFRPTPSHLETPSLPLPGSGKGNRPPPQAVQATLTCLLRRETRCGAFS